MIWIVVLAAGESRRMGTPKLLLPFGDTTILGAVVRTAQALPGVRTLVVLGAEREAVRSILESEGVDIAVNEDYQLGMLTSVQTGFRALPADAEAAVIMLGDQPLIGPEVIGKVLKGFEDSRKGIVVPTFQGRPGHPVLIDLKFRDEVLAIDPAVGLHQLALAHPEEIFEVEAGDPRMLRDVDTPEDYAAIVKP